MAVSDSDPASNLSDHSGTAGRADSVGASGLERLTPTQRRTYELLRRDAPVEFSERFVDELCADVAAAMAEFAERLDGSAQTVWVSKHLVSSVLGCEVQHLADDAFTWTPAIAGGQVAHRAIELMLNWRGDPVPAELVDEAIERLAVSEQGLGDWLARLGEADRADLRSVAVEKVVNFQECFPPLRASARPRTEAKVRWPLDGPVVLSGKVDLVLGAADAGRESRKVIVDLKTGSVAPRHREDLRFYALVETLRLGIPPRKLASFYLDSGTAVVEDITESVLRTAARRTLDGVHREIELRVEGATPVARPGTSCRWCPLAAADCADGAAYLARRAAGDLDPAHR